VRGSAARLGQVFLNLIINAAHALPESRLQHNRLQVRSFDDGAEVVVEVEDNGPGIPAEEMGQLFVEFQQLSSGVASRHGGTGLGLALVQKIIVSHNGRVSIGTSPSGGARLEIVLPIV